MEGSNNLIRRTFSDYKRWARATDSDTGLLPSAFETSTAES